MDQHTLIAVVTGRLQPDPRIRALFLSASFGKGTADAAVDGILAYRSGNLTVRRLQECFAAQGAAG